MRLEEFESIEKRNERNDIKSLKNGVKSLKNIQFLWKLIDFQGYLNSLKPQRTLNWFSIHSEKRKCIWSLSQIGWRSRCCSSKLSSIFFWRSPKEIPYESDSNIFPPNNCIYPYVFLISPFSGMEGNSLRNSFRQGKRMPCIWSEHPQKLYSPLHCEILWQNYWSGEQEDLYRHGKLPSWRFGKLL